MSAVMPVKGDLFLSTSTEGDVIVVTEVIRIDDTGYAICRETDNMILVEMSAEIHPKCFLNDMFTYVGSVRD